jgi:hypothetical protein
MKDNIEGGRAEVIKGLEKVQYVNQQTPGLYIVTIFMDSKREEVINIFSQASATDKPKVVNVLKSIDPAHSNDYNTRILNAK